MAGFLDPILTARGDESLWVYEADRDPRKTKPKETGFENYFYSYEVEGEKVHTVEQILGSIETVVAPILKKLVGGNFDLTQEERSEFAGFIALSYTRTPFYRKISNEITELLQKKLTELAADVPGYFERVLPQVGVTENVEEEAGKLRKFVKSGFEVEQVDKGYAIKMAFNMTLTLIPVVERMSWVFYITEDKARFIATDATISLFDTQGSPFTGIGFASSPRAEFRFPLSRNICLVGNWQGMSGPSDIPPTVVRDINKVAMYYSRRFVYVSENSSALRDLYSKIYKEIPEKRIKAISP